MKRNVKQCLHKASDAAIVQGCHKRHQTTNLIDSIDMTRTPRLGMIETLAHMDTIEKLDAAVAVFDATCTGASEKTKRRFRRKANLRAKILLADK